MQLHSENWYAHILHQAVARAARHSLVRVSAALCAAETRQLRKVQDVSMRIAVKMPAILSMGFKAESVHPKGAHSRLWSPQTGRLWRPVCGL